MHLIHPPPFRLFHYIYSYTLSFSSFPPESPFAYVTTAILSYTFAQRYMPLTHTKHCRWFFKLQFFYFNFLSSSKYRPNAKLFDLCGRESSWRFFSLNYLNLNFFNLNFSSPSKFWPSATLLDLDDSLTPSSSYFSMCRRCLVLHDHENHGIKNLKKKTEKSVTAVGAW